MEELKVLDMLQLLLTKLPHAFSFLCPFIIDFSFDMPGLFTILTCSAIVIVLMIQKKTLSQDVVKYNMVCNPVYAFKDETNH